MPKHSSINNPGDIDPQALLEYLRFQQLILDEAFNEVSLLRQQNRQLRVKIKRLVALLCPAN